MKFTEIGKDQEYWAGNFGAQFSCESVQLIMNDPSKDIVGKMGSRRFYELPIQTYFNHAMGEACYIDGNKYQAYGGWYNNLNDFDFMQCYPTRKVTELKLTNCEPIELSNNYQCSLYSREAWNGSSCLQIRGLLQSFQGTAIKILKTDITANGNMTISLNVKNLDKNKNMVSVILKFGNDKCVKYDPTKITLNNQWDSIQFTIQSQNAIRGIYLLIRNLKNYQTNYDILLGGLGIYDDRLADKIKQLVDFKDPARYVKGIQLCESLANIANTAAESILFDLYLLFDFPEEILKMIKTIRIFQ